MKLANRINFNKGIEKIVLSLTKSIPEGYPNVFCLIVTYNSSHIVAIPFEDDLANFIFLV